MTLQQLIEELQHALTSAGPLARVVTLDGERISCIRTEGTKVVIELC